MRLTSIVVVRCTSFPRHQVPWNHSTHVLCFHINNWGHLLYVTKACEDNPLATVLLEARIDEKSIRGANVWLMLCLLVNAIGYDWGGIVLIRKEIRKGRSP